MIWLGLPSRLATGFGTPLLTGDWGWDSLLWQARLPLSLSLRGISKETGMHSWLARERQVLMLCDLESKERVSPIILFESLTKPLPRVPLANYTANATGNRWLLYLTPTATGFDKLFWFHSCLWFMLSSSEIHLFIIRYLVRLGSIERILLFIVAGKTLSIKQVSQARLSQE